MNRTPEAITSLAEDVIGYINDGVMDDFLRDIARACYGRRDVINGTNTVIPDPADVTPELLRHGYFQANVSSDVFSGRIDAYDRGGPGMFEFGGDFYRKSDIVGKTITISAFSTTDVISANVGKRVMVTGVGRAKVQVHWVDAPAGRGTMRRAYDSKAPVFLPRGILAPYLA